MNDQLAVVRSHLRAHFSSLGMDSEPDVAGVTFLGVERIEVLRFGPDRRAGLDGVFHHVTLGCSRHPMSDPAAPMSDPLRGPRAEVVLSLRSAPGPGLARSLAVVAATPAVEGVVLTPDALIDLSGPLWQEAPFTAVLLGVSDTPELELADPLDPVQFLSAAPITQTEGAWVRLRGAGELRQAWADDGVDTLDPRRPASAAGGRHSQ